MSRITLTLIAVFVLGSLPMVFADSHNDMPTIHLDRDVYPVPFGSIDDFEDTMSSHPEGRSLFPVHHTAIVADKIEQTETLGTGDLMVHIRVHDPSFDTSSTSTDKISQDIPDTTVGPVKIGIIRDSQVVILVYAGGSTPNENGVIDVEDNNIDDARQLGAIHEVHPEAGIFELDFVVRYTDGPASSKCPVTAVFTSLNSDMPVGSEESRFDAMSAENENYCIMNGDVLYVDYTFVRDGKIIKMQDNAKFELRDAVLEVDKTIYPFGHDLILTLVEPDLDLDNDAIETYDLDLRVGFRGSYNIG